MHVSESRSESHCRVGQTECSKFARPSLSKLLTLSGSATVWFDTVPVWGFEGGLQANGHKWRHPSHDCGRDDVPVPPPEGRHPMWEAEVESRISRKAPAVGSKHPCHLVGVPNSIRIFMDFLFVLIPSAESFSTTKWSAALVWLDTHVNVVCQGWCCHWLRKVKQKQAEGAVICCAVSNIYARAAWLLIFS